MEHLFFEGVARPLRRRTPSVPRLLRPRSLEAEPVAMDAFLAWLLEQAHLDPAKYRARCFMRRLAACLRQLRVSSPAQARHLIESRPELLAVALDAVLLGVTQFFRDETVFECIRTQVLPEFSRARRPLRVWSAACSDGAELYSIAMLLADAGRLSECELLGTDCRPGAIERAAAGLYPREALRDIDPAYRRHFAPAGPHMRISPELREATRWETQNLLVCPAPGPWDMILWRNMSIYLESDVGAALWHSLAGELRPGGYLVAGKADHPPRELGWSRIAPCLYRKSECMS